VVDLRSTAELEAEGRGELSSRSLHFHHLPLFDGDTSKGRSQAEEMTLADRYFLMAEFAAEPIARVVSTLAESDAPAVFHCAAGKDRTGVISAILLGILGVRDEVIVMDYAASQDQLDAIVDRLMQTEGYQEMFEQLPPDTLHAEPDTMVSLLDRVREKYGDMDGYAREIGISERTIDRLRARLLD
jgi:protein tyrosine/serine phosphatase